MIRYLVRALFYIPILIAPSWAADLPHSPFLPSQRLTLASRCLAQDQGDWQIDYRFRNATPYPVALDPAAIRVVVEGWLSNSRVAAHGRARWVAHNIDGRSTPESFADVVPSPDDAERCRERATLAVWADGDHVPAAASIMPVAVSVGGQLCVRIRLEHRHVIYGDYDTLLGVRSLILHLGGDVLRDSLPLDREQYLAMPTDTWPEPDIDHKDDRTFHSAPDSLLLDASAPGQQYFRFPERKVRYSTRMRLTFWYRIAPGSQGEFKARVAQYRESVNSWKVLGSGMEWTLGGAGVWRKFTRVFMTHEEATTLALDLRIANSECGECWVDDVSLEPVDTAPQAP